MAIAAAGGCGLAGWLCHKIPFIWTWCFHGARVKTTCRVPPYAAAPTPERGNSRTRALLSSLSVCVLCRLGCVPRGDGAFEHKDQAINPHSRVSIERTKNNTTPLGGRQYVVHTYVAYVNMRLPGRSLSSKCWPAIERYLLCPFDAEWYSL